MAYKVNWIQNIKNKFTKQNPRDHNTEAENELLDQAKERFEIARSQKVDGFGRNLHDRWEQAERLYRGDHWHNKKVPSFKSTPVLNFCLSLIESTVPRLTDSQPEIMIQARKGGRNQGLADMLTSIHEYLWYTNRMDERSPELVRTGLQLGTSILKTYWDVDALDKLGEVSYSFVDPYNFFPDYRAYEIDQMEYCFVSFPKSLEYIARRWDEKGPLVWSDNDWVNTRDKKQQSSLEDVASIYEYWFRDKEGHLCVMYYAGDIVLQVSGGEYDNSNEPIYRHNKFPFSKFVDYKLRKEFWGMGELEIVALLQDLINNFEAQIIDNTRLMGNAQWVVNKMLSGLREEDAWIFDNRPGNVIFTQNDGVRKEPGTPLPQHIPDHQERLIFAMEQILGIHDVVQGRRPVGVRAASAIIALQESANVRVRDKARHLGYAIRDAAEQATGLVLEFYDEERKHRIAGSVEPTTLNVREALNKVMVDQAAMAGLVEEGVSPDEVPAEMMDQIYQEVKFPEFDVEVKVGPSVPYSQALLYEQAKEFYQIGAIDQQALLEITNFPNREEIIARMHGAPPGQEGERVGERTFGAPGG